MSRARRRSVAARRLLSLALLATVLPNGRMAAADPLGDASAAALLHQRRLVWLSAHEPAACKRALVQLAAVTATPGGDASEQRRRLLDHRHAAAEELRALATLKVPADVRDVAAREAKRLDALPIALAAGRPPAFTRAQHVYYVRPAPPPIRTHDGEPTPLRWRDGIVTALDDEAAQARGKQATLVWIDQARFADDRGLPKAKLDAALEARLASGPPRDEMWTFIDDRMLDAAVETTAMAGPAATASSAATAIDPAIQRAAEDDLAALAKRAPRSNAAAVAREAAALVVQTGKAAELAKRGGFEQSAQEFSRWQEFARGFTLRP